MSATRLLVFTLADSRYALRADTVREVVRAVAIAVLPKAPPIVEGIINVRGDIVPVLDIRRRFGRPAVPNAPDQHLIIATAGTRTVALRVDQAVELLEVAADAFDESASLPPGVEYVAGIARLPDGLIVIHDLDRFLALDEAKQLDTAVRAADGGRRKRARRGSA